MAEPAQFQKREPDREEPARDRAEPEARPLSEHEERRIDKLQGSVDESSRLVRNLTFIFLLVGLYIAILGGATDHELLLRAGDIQMPLLNVGASVLWFYALAPPLFLLLHFNLLLQLYFLSRKAHALDQELAELTKDDQERQRGLLFPLPFTLMVLGRQYPPLIRRLLRIMVFVTIAVLPAILLLWMQLRFLPYQSFWITTEHRLVLSLDLLLVWLVWPMLGQSSGSWWDWWQTTKGRVTRLPILRTEVLPGRIRALSAASLGLVLLMFSWLVAVIPYSPLDRLARGVGIAGVVFDRPGGFVRRSLELPGEILMAREPAPALIIEYGWTKAFQEGDGLDLQNRSLRNAHLWGSILINALLRGADLRGADATFAQLDRVDLGEANLQGANFGGVRLSGAALDEADLQGTDLTEADLKGAHLFEANLQGATLRLADLQVANLYGADLRGADLREADLRGAFLLSADLRGTDLDGADVRDADLRHAHVWRARLYEAEGLSDRWVLANLRGIGIEPVEEADELGYKMKPMEDVKGFIEGVLQEIEHKGARKDVRERLQKALIEDDRPEAPSFPRAWRVTPNVMFAPNDPLPQRLGWGARMWATGDAYEEDLAWFLGGLACRETASVHLAEGFFGRLQFHKRPYGKRLAARLVGDDCPPAAELHDVVRKWVEKLAAR